MELFKNNLVPEQTLGEFFQIAGGPLGVETTKTIQGVAYKSGDVGARVEIRPEWDPTIGLITYDDAGAEVFKVLIDGTDVGDVIMGDTTSSYVKWDKSLDTLTIKGALTPIVSMTAGETINGATLPVPVYVNSTDNEFYACDANDNDKLEFVGFAVSNSTDGNAIDVQFSNVVAGFTGLTEGSFYYVQDTVGTIGTTPGTAKVLVGIAVSATQLFIFKQAAAVIEASDILRDSADADRSTESATYTKLKEIKYNEQDGTIRVKFDLWQDGGGTGWGRIYKNGVAYGTEQSEVSNTPVTYSQDLAFVRGDLIQLYVHDGAGAAAHVQNFRLYYSKAQAITPGTVNTD